MIVIWLWLTLQTLILLASIALFVASWKMRHVAPQQSRDAAILAMVLAAYVAIATLPLGEIIAQLVGIGA